MIRTFTTQHSILFILLLLIFTSISSQDYNNPGGTVTTCAGTFYDSGGSAGNYADNETITTTICPDVVGDCVSLDFTSLDTELLVDIITIYDGTSTIGTAIASFTGFGTPGIVEASNGCITVEFISDGSINAAGWEAAISCSPCPVIADCISSDNLVVVPSPTANDEFMSGEVIDFCYTLTSWNFSNSNWLHGVVPFFGSGWDVASLVTYPPTSCSGSGTWAWYSSWTSTNSGLTFGPGFSYDTGTDGPGNNWGDNCAGGLTFCWDITVGSCPPNSDGDNLDVDIFIYGDADSGSWSLDGCTTNDVYNFSAEVICCITDPFAGNDGTVTICEGDGAVNLFDQLTGGAETTGAWTGPSTLTGGQLGTFTPGTNVGGTYNYLIDIGDCVPDDADVIVTYTDCAIGATSVVTCDDGIPCTINDEEEILDCNGFVCVPCAGTPTDCSDGASTIQSCDDGDPCTINDEETILDCDNTVCVPCAGTPTSCATGELLTVQACDDFDFCTVNDEETVDCAGNVCIPCAGTVNDCTVGPFTVFPCNDSDPCTENDEIIYLTCDLSICTPCAGTPMDCSGTTTVQSCDDLDACTINDEETIACDGSVCIACIGTGSGTTIPTFTAIGPLCANSTAPSLPSSSIEAITGTWIPATISTATVGSTTYDFTADPGQCASNTSMTIVIDAEVVPTFTQESDLCESDADIALPTTSLNSISGTWSPTTLGGSNSTSTFTPDVGECATTTTMSIVIDTEVTPTFTQLADMCSSDAATTLPTSSTNGFDGTWSPTSLGGSNSSATFTPDAGECATTASMSIIIDSEVTPTFTQLNDMCDTDPTVTLANTSINGIIGTWSPTTLGGSNTSSTFTPNASECATTTSMSIVVSSQITPTFTQLLDMCDTDAPVSLPTTSNNGITGSWSPTTLGGSNSSSTFTPDAGQCGVTTTMSIAIVTQITPTFTQLLDMCDTDAAVSLSTTSTNGITGSWSPSTLGGSNSSSTFTPDAGQCGVTTSMSIVITVETIPTFTQLNDMCDTDPAVSLPTISLNGITGAWSPTTLGGVNTSSTFTPDVGQCSATVSMTIIVDSEITPTFTQLGDMCDTDPAVSLPTTSLNGITGAWSPTTLGGVNTTSTFTSDAGQCGGTTAMTIIVDSEITPTFTQLADMCDNEPAVSLTTTSLNGITGSWSPTTLGGSNSTSTFTPDPGQCGATATMIITITSAVDPTFSVIGPFCQSATATALPLVSNNGFSGTWSPAVINTVIVGSTNYSFTPDTGECSNVTSIPIVIDVCTSCPDVDDVTIDNALFCEGESINVNADLSGAGGAIIEWTDPSGSLVVGNPLSFQSATSSGCNESQSISYTITCVDDGSLLDSGTFNFDVYPIINPTVTATDCAVSVEDLCPDWSSSYSTGSGSIVGTNFDADPGASGTVIFSITDNNAPSGCNSVSISEPFNCSVECPNLIDLDPSSVDICSGEPITISASLDNDILGEVHWLVPGEPTVVSPSINLNLTSSSCTETVLIGYQVHCFDTGAITSSGEVTVNIFSPMTTTIVADGCVGAISQDCPDYYATYVQGGTTFDGFTYYPAYNESGVLNFTVTNPNAPAGCNTIQQNVVYDCQANCPQISVVTQDFDACSNGLYSFTALLNNFQLGTIDWTFPDGSSSTGIASEYWFTSQSGCNEVQQVLYDLVCYENGETIFSSVINVSIFVEPDASVLINENCLIEIEPDCNDFEISWSTATEQGTGTTALIDNFEAGDVTFEFLNEDAPVNCDDNDLIVPYECIAFCPVVTGTINDDQICDGDLISLEVNLDDTTLGVVQWTLADGSTISGTTISIPVSSVSGCSEDQTIQYEVICNDNSEVVASDSFNYTVYPEINYSVTGENTCEVEVSVVCANEYTISWDDGTDQQNGSIYSLASDASGSVSWTISNTNSAAGCMTETFATLYDCMLIDCPVFDSLTTATTEICDGDNIDASVLLDDPSLGYVEWTLPSGSTIIGFSLQEVINSVNGCSEDQNLNYAVYCYDSGEEIHSGSFVVNVFPEINYAIDGENTCFVSIDLNCPNDYSVIWDDGLDSQTATFYQAADDTNGLVNWTINSIDAPVGCAISTFSSAFTCDENNCPGLIAFNDIVAPTCSGTNIPFFVDVSDVSLADIQWTLPDGSFVTDPSFDYTASDVNCSELQTIDLLVTCIDDGSTIVDEQFSFTIFAPVEVNISNTGCTITLTDECGTYQYSYISDGGALGPTNVFETVFNTQGSVTFTVTDLTAPIGCNELIEIIDFQCPEECPTIVVVEAQPDEACDGEDINLSVTVDENISTNVEWILPDGSLEFGENIVYTATSASGCNEVVSFGYDVYCIVNDELLESGIMDVQIFVEPTGQLIVGDCVISLTEDCPEFLTTYEVDSEIFTGSVFTAAPAQAGSVTFLMTNEDAPLDCASAEYLADFDCPDSCPAVVSITNSSDFLCIGDATTIAIELNDESLANIDWILPDGSAFTGTQVDYVGATNDPCQELLQYAYEITCIDDGSIIEQGVIDITVIQDIVFTSDIFDCLIEISTACNLYEVDWNDGTNIGSGLTYTAASNSNGTVDFTVSYPSANFDCGSSGFILPYNCPAVCPVIVATPDDNYELCSDGTLDLSIEIDQPGLASVSYTLPDGTILDQTAISIVLESVSGCDEVQTITYEVKCIDNDEIILSNSISVSVYAAIDAAISSDGCAVIVNTSCLEHEATWDDGTTSGSGFIYNAADFIVGTVDFTITNPNSLAGCTSPLVLIGNIDCPSLCTEIVAEVELSDVTVCENDGLIDLSAYLSVNSSIDGIWSSNEITIENNRFVDIANFGGQSYVVSYSVAPPSSDPFDCPGTDDDLFITIEALPVIEFADNPEICNITFYNSILDFTTLVTEESGSGFWTDMSSSHASGTFPELDFNGITEGYYDFSYTTQSAIEPCEDITEIITVHVADCSNFATYPTAFSPNGDNMNDVFRPIGRNMDQVTLQIFDRWGNLIHQSYDALGWDGTYNNESCELGVYIMRSSVIFLDGETFTFQGNVTLIR